MKIYLIRLKLFPSKYVGKKNCYYCFWSDNQIQEYMKGNHCRKKVEKLEDFIGGIGFFVNRKRAKTWTGITPIKSLYTYCGKYYDSKSQEDKMSTFSQYEVEIDDNGKITCIPLDDFVKLR